MGTGRKYGEVQLSKGYDPEFLGSTTTLVKKTSLMFSRHSHCRELLNVVSQKHAPWLNLSPREERLFSRCKIRSSAYCKERSNTDTVMDKSE